MAEIPLALIERLIKKAGAGRVSQEAVKALRNRLEKIAIKISKKSVELARHAGRRIIKVEDIELAKG